jgi:2,4-diaminopentanoate dehydrogenase
VLSGVSSRISSVRVMEILNYATYDQPEVLFDTMGFGQALDATPMLLIPGILGYAWGGAVQTIAEGLGVDLEEIREVHEREPFDRPIEVAGRVVEPGTTAGLRFEIQGIAHGRPVVIVEHVTRLHDDVAPDWPEQVGQGLYRVIVEGEPTIHCELTFSGEDGDHNSGGLIVTATRLLNAVPAVVAAAPGMLSVLDLPLTTGKGLVTRS